MSVLNQSGEEQVECPLCMEPLEVDDLNFFPCTCGYQICRFCWHRIRTDENGLCPACRKAYSENPADFIPLSREQVAKLKAEKRQRDQQRKAKLTENRKHLASVRVVQKNLVFVVGLPLRLADPEVLKRHEYFGKFGKIHKVVINQSTSYAGSQGPSASAYVTYMKSDDALRAIQSVNNITIDGRLIKSSLGTTKYCSHFMKNQPCPKPDCMYLHDFGDPEASFTKEQMHAGKHQEYEKKLHESLNTRTNNTMNADGKTSAPIPTSNSNTSNMNAKSSSKENVMTALSSSVSSSSSTTSNSSSTTNKENWPHLNNNVIQDKEKERKERSGGKKSKTKNTEASKKERKEANSKNESRSSGSTPVGIIEKNNKINSKESKMDLPPLSNDFESSSSMVETRCTPTALVPVDVSKLTSPTVDDNSSFFSLNAAFQKVSVRETEEERRRVESEETEADGGPSTVLTDQLPVISTTEDWAAAFGFARSQSEHGAVDDISKINEIKPSLNTFRNGFPETLRHDSGLSKGVESYNNSFYDIPSKLSMLDLLMTNKNGFASSTTPTQTQPTPSSSLNGLDQNMSKFFTEFHKNNKEAAQQFPNGFAGLHQNYYAGVQSNTERIMLLQQKQLEEQLLSLSLKQGYGNSSNSLYQNGVTQQPAYGENSSFGTLHSQLYGCRSNIKASSRNSEDDLGFDPFQETQKAFAELMASEQNHKTHSSNNSSDSTGHSQINVVIHNQNGGHLPPPPPGFVQPNTHMNSFGSKILPFLNMTNSQQINSSTQNNWPSSFNSQLHQQKNISNSCNDWKVLDPAILSSSRHYPLANLSQVRDPPYANLSQIQNGGGAPPLRSYEYAAANNAFTNFAQQLQPNFNNFSHNMNSQQNNLNWFSNNDINSQISSPPGFRNTQATKQQEC